MLWSYLNSHPNVICLKSIFNLKNKINFSKHYPYHVQIDKINNEELVNYRNENPNMFLDEFVYREYYKSTKAVGFKFFYGSTNVFANLNQINEYILSKTNSKVIHLIRENKLRTYVSLLRSTLTGLWNIDSLEDKVKSIVYKNDKVIVNALKFQEYVDTQNQEFLKYKSIYKGNALEIKYKELVENPEFELDRIQKYLNLENYQLFTETQKVNLRKMDDVVKNFSDLKNHFKGTKYYKYFKL